MPLELPAPEGIERCPEENNGDADQRLLRASYNRIQRPRSGHEEVESGQIRIAGAAVGPRYARSLAPQNKKRSDASDVRQHHHEHDVGIELVVAATESKNDRPRTDRNETEGRRAVFGMNPSHGVKKRSVACHGVGDARAAEDRARSCAEAR